jgi:hypothetical protein
MRHGVARFASRGSSGNNLGLRELRLGACVLGLLVLLLDNPWMQIASALTGPKGNNSTDRGLAARGLEVVCNPINAEAASRYTDVLKYPMRTPDLALQVVFLFAATRSAKTTTEARPPRDLFTVLCPVSRRSPANASSTRAERPVLRELPTDVFPTHMSVMGEEPMHTLARLAEVVLPTAGLQRNISSAVAVSFRNIPASHPLRARGQIRKGLWGADPPRLAAGGSTEGLQAAALIGSFSRPDRFEYTNEATFVFAALVAVDGNQLPEIAMGASREACRFVSVAEAQRELAFAKHRLNRAVAIEQLATLAAAARWAEHLGHEY